MNATDAEVIAKAVDRNKTGIIITDGQARVIAAAWHGGQASAMCAFATSGAIDYDQLIDELDHEWKLLSPDGVTTAPELLALTRYVVDRGARNPVPRWHKLWGSAALCDWTTHYGCLGPRWAVDPDGEQSWTGQCGAITDNASGMCDEHESDWRDNYPTHPIPRGKL